MVSYLYMQSGMPGIWGQVSSLVAAPAAKREYDGHIGADKPNTNTPNPAAKAATGDHVWVLFEPPFSHGTLTCPNLTFWFPMFGPCLVKVLKG